MKISSFLVITWGATQGPGRGFLKYNVRDMIKDTLQKMLETKLELGYSKEDRKGKQTNNSRNRYTKKRSELSPDRCFWKSIYYRNIAEQVY